MENVSSKLKKFPYLFLLMLFCSLTLWAQQGKTVKGVVLDGNGDPVIGASVVVKGSTAVGTITDLDGNFTLNVPDEKSTLVFSFIGMTTQELRVPKSGFIRVTLEDDTEMLDEVVVVGYGQQKKASVVGAITQTNSKVLERTGGVSDLGSALTGNLPGVITSASTGMPGEEDPQILIRGSSTWNDSAPLILIDGIERPMSGLDVNSVESVSVLKDASATAVYGVKGANGVILITTKRGQEGKATINASANMTVKMLSKLPNKLDSYDAFHLRNEAVEYELGLTPASWQYMMNEHEMLKYRNPANLAETERYPNVDWADWMFKDAALAENVNVSMNGGTKILKYYAAIDYQHEGDMFKVYDNGRGYKTGYGYDRVNMRSNMDFQLTKTTVLKMNLSGSYGVRLAPIDANEYNLWGSAYTTAPNAMIPVYSDGSWGYNPENDNNSVALLANGGQNTITTTRLYTDFTLEQNLDFILKGLKAKATISWDNVFVENNRGVNSTDAYQRKWINPETGEVSYSNTTGSHNFDFYPQSNWTITNGTVDNNQTQRNLFYLAQLDWNRTFGSHTVGAMGVFQRSERATGSEIPHYREDWAFRVTYDYANKYFFEYNGAYNGSEKFSDANRFVFFNSGAVGWMISEEKFMGFSKKWLDMLKIRASYGEIGNDNINGRWLYMDDWATGGNILTGLYNAASPYTFYRENTVGNPDIHWEKTQSWDIGVEAEFGKGYMTLSYFDNDVKDLIQSTRRGYDAQGYELYQYVNVETARIRGIENVMGYRFGDTLEGRISSTWLDAENTAAHTPLAQRARLTQVWQLIYDDREAVGWRAVLWDQMNYDYMTDPLYPGVPGTRKSYNLVNFTVTRKLGGKGRIFCGINNVFDKTDEACDLDGRFWNIGWERQF